MTQKTKVKSWNELKQAGNEFFKAGQYGEATRFYSQAIDELHKSNPKNVEDLSVLHSNRAASYLKEGNCAECFKDCNISLELVPFNVKSLLRRAAASEAQERYRQAYVDYKTALQLDANIAAAHDGANRMTKALTEVDGPAWREKLPAIPVVPLAVREKMSQAAPRHNGATGDASTNDARRAKALKEEGNALVKKGDHARAVDKYTQSILCHDKEAAAFTNRALCYLALKRYRDAVGDCDAALALDGVNVKALYRRAQAYKELKNMTGCIQDLKELLEVEPTNMAAIKLLQEVQQLQQQEQPPKQQAPPPQEKKKKTRNRKK
ncbi:mitochondrial import receptor subunit TOM34 [Corythoichthys intestinalis]|uniref:mitochondrial import receptor subunit TOM34 n=1 Tax=Corythoichthys intestinalis TaxID=161448 RepID=UPI0025A63C27|nr:mitochondrial import receptor subunit TOM34 [Corythoichthys intestinalis]XP_061814188.1 mitochondrial import receptor subunit TOM34-like [Nerophis lumbriciformis]